MRGSCKPHLGSFILQHTEEFSLTRGTTGPQLCLDSLQNIVIAVCHSMPAARGRACVLDSGLTVSACKLGESRRKNLVRSHLITEVTKNLKAEFSLCLNDCPESHWRTVFPSVNSCFEE